MEQATQEYDGKILKRWYVYTDVGRKIVWAESAQAARAKVEQFRRVKSVHKAPGILP